MKKILIIQTAFIGDVILATTLIESIYLKYPKAQIDFLVRKGNEGLLENHPKLKHVFVWDKQQKKYGNLRRLIGVIRKEKYDLLLNLQRFGATGYLTWRSKAEVKVGFEKNPFSFCYTHKVPHEIGAGTHEVDRNFELLKVMDDFTPTRPKLYPPESAIHKADDLAGGSVVIVMAPSSVWFTKQLPKSKWVELIKQYTNEKILLIGAKSDRDYLDEIIQDAGRSTVLNMAGELNLLESAALIKIAKMTHVNDSAPLHLASAMNAPVTAYFCSTIPDFGFGPLSDIQHVKETTEKLDCRPCGLHGKAACPLQHFKCGNTMDVTIN